ncbi:adenosine-specific kinase [bacterium]|nr:adenosine-specific kinase [bacterium]
MKTEIVPVSFPEGANIILGMSHFIKTVEDLYEVMVNSGPQAQFGLAFCEASQDRLIRTEGNNAELIECAATNAFKIGAGHSFLIIMKMAFPLTVLNDIKDCREVCHVFCATANPVQVIVAQTDLGRAIIGVIDGMSPLGIEDEHAKTQRKAFLRQIGYKR